MHIGFEATAACRPIRTGVARYAIHLMRALTEGFDKASSDRFDAYVRRSRRFKRGWQPPGIDGVTWRYYHDSFPPRGPRPDLVHGLELRLPRWARRCRARLATVHDLFALVSDDLLDPDARERNRRRYEEVARTADHVLAVSESTRRDFLRFHDFDPDRVHVTPLGVDERFRPRDPVAIEELRRRLGLQAPFFLYVGDVTPRKNLARLIRAFGASEASGDHELVLSGSLEDGRAQIEEELRRCPARGRIRILGFVPEADLPLLYSAAAALLYPTLYEGFGLPVLEALASGTPALGSDVGSVPEVAGGHAVLVDPRDVDSIAAGIDRVREVDAEARRRARRHAAGFTWARCAAATRTAYEACLETCA